MGNTCKSMAVLFQCMTKFTTNKKKKKKNTGVPFPTPGSFPNQGIKPASAALAGRFSTTEPPGKLKVACDGYIT